MRTEPHWAIGRLYIFKVECVHSPAPLECPPAFSEILTHSLTWTSSSEEASQLLHHGCQHPWSNCDGGFLSASPSDRNMGFLQIQKETEENCSQYNGDGTAGKPGDKLGGGGFHNDR